MKNKYPYGIGPAGYWLIFAGIPVAICAVLLATTLRDGNIRGVSEKFLPYVVFFVPVAIVIVCKIIYDHFPKKLIIPVGIIGWIIGLSVMCWYFWVGPGAIGHY
jgi:hypothetical protein